MRILFAGTPGIAVPSLERLSGDVVAVLSAPDRPKGRGRRITASPVKVAAEKLGLPVLQPERLNAEARQAVQKFRPELLVVFAYGRIFGPKFLALFSAGGINLHPSALPLYRGPSPITAAILAGEKESAITVQKISLKMDCGDILRQRTFPLTGRETTGSLTDWIAEESPLELESAIRMIGSGRVNAVAQDESLASYCSIVRKSDGIIRWTKDAQSLERMIRAYQPWPKARTCVNGTELALLQAKAYPEENAVEAEAGMLTAVDKKRGLLIQTGKGLLGVTRLQAATKNPVDFHSYRNNAACRIGMRFGEGA